eukprot:tig00000145_g8858.t1
MPSASAEMCRGNYYSTAVGLVRLLFSERGLTRVESENDCVSRYGSLVGGKDCAVSHLPALPKTAIVCRPDDEHAIARLRVDLREALATVVSLDDNDHDRGLGAPVHSDWTSACTSAAVSPTASPLPGLNVNANSGSPHDCAALPPLRKPARRGSLPGLSRVPLLVPVSGSRPASPVRFVAHRGPARPNTPVHARFCALPSKAASAPASASHLRCACHIHVLLADDCPLNRMLGARVFASYCPHARVDVVSDGQAAVTAFEEAAERGQPYDACILDLEMPHKSGLEAAREIRRLERAQRRARPARLLAWSTLLCGETGAVVESDCHGAGFCSTCPKPAQPAVLLSAALAGIEHDPACPLAPATPKPRSGPLAPLRPLPRARPPLASNSGPAPAPLRM